MRFVPSYCLREGMILAKPIYGEQSKFMLAKGIALTQAYIRSIQRLQINGIYIEDDISKDIEIQSVISDTLKMETVKKLKNIFTMDEKKQSIGQSFNKLSEIQKNIDDIIDEIINNKQCIINIIDLKVFDEYTYYHSINVTVISIIIGLALGLNKIELCKLGMGAMLHDIGKVFIDKDILQKQGKLTDEEYLKIQQHSLLGYNYVKEKFNLPVESRVAILEHHERFDGTGYPLKRKGDAITLFARIIAIADVYDALTSDRPYRKATSPSEAMEYVMGGSGTLFDPNLIPIFAQKVAPYPVGTCVILSNNLIGIVVENHNDCLLRPVIRIVKFKDMMFSKPYEVDLKYSKEFLSTTITGMAEI